MAAAVAVVDDQPDSPPQWPTEHPDPHVWPGVFSGHLLHRVQPGNARRVQAAGRTFGLADCGAACVDALDSGLVERTACLDCWTAPAARKPDNDRPPPRRPAIPRSPLPKRTPRPVPPPPRPGPPPANPNSGWFTPSQDLDTEDRKDEEPA